MAWNTRLGGRPVAIVGDELPSFALPDGLTLTLLSPDLHQLSALAKPWDEALEEAQKVGKTSVRTSPSLWST